MRPTAISPIPNNRPYPLAQEHRTRLYQILCDLDNEQLQIFLSKHVQNSSLINQFTREQLIQQSLIIIDNYYSADLEQTLLNLTQQRLSNEFYSHFPQQQQQQQQRPSPYFYSQQSGQYNPQSNYRFASSPTLSQQLRSIRPNSISTQQQQQQQREQSSYTPSQHVHQEQNQNSSTNPTRHIVQRYPAPITIPPSIVPKPYSFLRPPNNRIVHKTLPFYHIISCIYERYNIFRYDTYRKQYISHDEFTLSLDACNQLALSYDFDPNLNIYTTSKCLLLRLIRTDQPPIFNGKYEDNLPVNVIIHINGHISTNLPTPKPSTRQQKDLFRPGREVDITSHCMFNPILKNDITITWTFRLDNKSLLLQYANAEYAMHVFLAERLTVENLCKHILNKPVKFFRDDSVKILAKARATDSDLGLEVSDQKLKLTCPIDQKRLKKPIRATTCQHLQCFDLTNYIALNEKSKKWICPVCNKLALYEDLQIDTYMDSILNSIQNHDITEITINGELRWTPIVPLDNLNESFDSKSNIKLLSSSNDFILIDDD
ncbi:hypothetical protein I4U23_026316 [Adineta vaga]|nr:hypothetical protein I4U23_026316 [Adineta vaga]